jgi:anti-anti-sigma regulatory factor
MLVKTRRKADPRTRLRLVAVSSETLRPLEVTGLTEYFTIYPTRDEALNAD